MKLALTLPWFTLLLCASAAADDGALFREQVAPVFERRCVSCHNDQQRKGELSLETAGGLAVGGESGAVVQPRDPAASLLLEYVLGDEPEMPQDGPPLSAAEIEALRRWIADGAAWPQGMRLEDKHLADSNWWSLRPIERPPLPALGEEDARRARTPVDAFVIARLREHGLSLSPPADRRTLARRLYFDLLGLPPTPEQIDQFVQDSSPTAYEELVDRLLASPHYGERWGRHWLDVVKYADTCGYDKDKLRPNAWPYRDYVIRSLNEDKPYWRFVQEQVAGDVLFPGKADGILGLGFIAAGPWDFIGHVEVPETKIDGRVARHIDRDEMVTNTLNTFTSLTVQCARCHNHKFDPITQRHYYSLQAVFAAVDRAERPYDLDPAVERRRGELAGQRDEARRQLEALEDEIRTAGGQPLADAEQQIEQLRAAAGLAEKHPAFGYHSQIAAEPGLAKWVQVDLGQAVDIARVVLRPCHDEFAGIGAGFGFPVRWKVEAADNPSFAAADGRHTLRDHTAADWPNPGLAAQVIEADGVRARYVRVTATRLVERKNDFIFALAELAVIDAAGENRARQAAVTALDSIEAPVRWAKANLTDGIWARAVDEKAAAQLAAAQLARREILARVETAQRIERRDRWEKSLRTSQQQLAALPRGKMVYAAASDFAPQGNFQPTQGTPRNVRLLHRGNVLEPGEVVQAGTVPVVPGAATTFELPADHAEGDRRAALARWLTRADHPLTWRSIVNRVWLYHFGRGLVATPNDFGRMGAEPTHPLLLDWLAAEFRDNGQSLKDLHRLLVTSAAYRQASTSGRAGGARAGSPPADASALAIDADNRYLWHMTRRRLSAEEIRDAILAVSGRLNLRMGGPGYYLFALEKTEHSPHYEYHKFDPEDVASHRRTVYRFIVRSQPDPFMTTLDCADSSQSTPQRGETMTALQALSLLNNKFNLAMAGHFAARLASRQQALPEQVERAMRLVTGRRPTADEREQLERYAARHGLDNLCRLLFNLSEFVYVD